MDNYHGKVHFGGRFSSCRTWRPCCITCLIQLRVLAQKSLEQRDQNLPSEANGRVVHRKNYANIYSKNIVEGAGHS